MSYILVYTILITNLEYAIIEPMASLEQCKRLIPVFRQSTLVSDARCAAIILDKE